MKKQVLVQFHEVFKVIRKNLYLLIIVAILSVGAALINILLIQTEKTLVDSTVKRDFKLFAQTLKIALFIISIKIPLEYIKAYLHGKFSENSLKDFREQIGKKLMLSQISLVEKNSSGDFISRLSSDLSIVQLFLTGTLNDVLYHPVVFVVGIVYGVSVSWQMTLFCFAVIPVVVLAAIFLTKPVEKFTRKQQDLMGQVNTVVQDAVSSAVLIKAFLLEDYIFKTFRESMRKWFKAGLKIARISALLEALKGVVQIAPVILLFLFGGYMVIKGKLTFGGLIAFVELMNIFLAPMHVLPNAINNYRKAKAAILRINEVLLHPDEELGKDKDGEKCSEYAIEFEDVVFSYDTSGKAVLDGVSFKIKKGEKVAIVGPSGCGKSTVVKLILGFYKPQSGQIKVFGKSLEKWDLKSLREKISVAGQEVFLFSESIYENIRYGKLDATWEEIEKACKKANIHDFIVKEAGGYYKEIGERGVNLSGGQRQRLAIARAILKNPDIFIFDEATSALDAESESLVQSELDRIIKDKTAIIVAHRFSTIKNVDRIIVLNNGKLCEQGTHEELMEKRGLYFDLYSKQVEREMKV